MVVSELRGEGDQLTDCNVLLLAPTGTAAHNINGITVHSALKLPINQHSKSSEYTPQSQEKLHELQTKYNGLTTVITDEISLISSQDLFRIH
ncbi:hypothetical protein DPMN_064225 [Dreissena polymorpha]|uniref:ATP-dependent DNA helicase n=1 Tax=Dreissena polymorpha TaxID=45954 RepID=A0A9D4CD26_DREPO|nr:hypothetical protein DPMN_064225 [Dreissena polymorpha]